MCPRRIPLQKGVYLIVRMDAKCVECNVSIKNQGRHVCKYEDLEMFFVIKEIEKEQQEQDDLLEQEQGEAILALFPNKKM